MTGLLGYGGAYKAINDADLLLLLGTDFPFTEFLPGDDVKKVQIDQNPKHIGRGTAIDLALVGRYETDDCGIARQNPEKSDAAFSGKTWQ